MADKRTGFIQDTVGQEDRVHNMQLRYVEYDKKTHSLGDTWESLSYFFGWRHPGGFYMHQLLRRRLLQLLNKNSLFLSNKSILDIGCGYGHTLRFLAEIRGRSEGLVGVDATPHRLDRARAINSCITFVNGDALFLPFPDQSFDVVTQFSVFEAFPDGPVLNKAVSELDRILKSGGFLIWGNLLPLPKKMNVRVRGYSLQNLESLFPSFAVVGHQLFNKRFTIAGKAIDSRDVAFRLSYLLADVIERLPFIRSNSMLAVLQKG